MDHNDPLLLRKLDELTSALRELTRVTTDQNSTLVSHHARISALEDERKEKADSLKHWQVLAFTGLGGFGAWILDHWPKHH